MPHQDVLREIEANFENAQTQIRNWQDESRRLEGEFRLIQRLIESDDPASDTPSPDSAGTPATE